MIESAPKAELHVHLVGAVPPDTLLELARRNRVPLPAETPAQLRDWFHSCAYRGVFRVIGQCLRTADDLELATHALARELAGQSVRYAEVMVTCATMEARGIGAPTYLEGMRRGRARARTDFGVELRWIFNTPRAIPDRVRRHYWADLTTELAIGGRDDGVVALGIAGAEAGSPPEEFAPWFERALAAGLHSVPHAGEEAGPASVWGAIRALGAERIAHGVRAIEDPALVAYLAEHRIPLDLCPTSNVCMGVFRSLAEHPVRKLHEAGVVVTVSSDDPTVFDTSVNRELALVRDRCGLSDADVTRIVRNGLRSGFEIADAA